MRSYAGAGQAFMLQPVTDKHSTAFGNPSIQIVPCPVAESLPEAEAGRCAFVSYFIFGEGAGAGEAGVVAFFNDWSGSGISRRVSVTF